MQWGNRFRNPLNAKGLPVPHGWRLAGVLHNATAQHPERTYTDGTPKTFRRWLLAGKIQTGSVLRGLRWSERQP